MPERGPLQGQVAVVFGGGRGFGQAIAQRFADAGAAVAISARTSGEIERTAQEIEARGGRALAVASDIIDLASVVRVREAAETAFGAAGIVVNAAGRYAAFGPVWLVDPDAWWASMEAQVRGALNVIHAFAPAMVERAQGRLITLTSSAGEAVRPSMSAYSVSKSAQTRLVEHLAQEARPHGVHAWAVHPGTAGTRMLLDALEQPDHQLSLPEENARLRGLTSEVTERRLAQCAALCLELATGQHDDRPEVYLRADAAELASARRTS